MSPYLAWFDEIPDEELAHAAGGKGASLCRMSRAGLPVPKGFIVRSEMFNAFMEANGLWDYVFEKLDTQAAFEGACRRGVAYVSGESFFADGRDRRHLRLNYSAATPEKIEEGIKILADYFKELLK